MTSRAARHQYVREPRKVWVAMIASARRAASQADGTAYGQSASDADPKVDLAARLRAPPRFPVADASAGLASEAFLKIASAFVTAGLPERRQRFAGALAAMATTLDDLLADETAAQQRGAYYLGLDRRMSLGGANRTDQAIGRNPADIAGDGWEARVVRSERERDRPTPWSHLAQQLGRTEEYLRRVYGGQFVEPPAGVLVIITRAPEPIEPSTPRGRPRKVPGMAPALSPSGAVLPIRPKSLEARVLFVLAGAQAALSPTEIAPRIGRGRHVVSNVLRALANKSLITRRRRSEWVTSDAGRALAVELMTMGGADG